MTRQTIEVDAHLLVEECLEYAVKRCAYRCFKHDETPITEADFLSRVDCLMHESFFQRWHDLVGYDD